jgi:DNA-3-methyladenine glycosylase II
MSAIARYDASVAFLRNLDDDWAGLVSHVGPCLHDPKAAREPYEALVRAIGYQQLTAKAGDAIIARLKALYPDTTFPTPETIMVAESTPCARAVSRRRRSPRSRPSRKAHCPA